MQKTFGGIVTAVAVSAVALSSFPALRGWADTQKYFLDGTYEEYVEQSNALNLQIMEEGMVLLKNNGLLPFSGSRKVTMFGYGSYRTRWGETGGGNGKKDYCYLADSLEKAGFTVNPDVKAVYEANTKKVNLSNASSTVSVEVENPVTILDDVKSSYANYGDLAIITISRDGKESSDLFTEGLGTKGWGENDHQLMLNTNEKDLIAEVKANFDNIVVLLNCPNTVQIPELDEDDEIDAILYVGLPGQYGLEAVGEVLNGQVNPSGRTVSLWAADFTKDPAFANVGTYSDSVDGTPSIEYEEGIYLGYKYYETAAEEGYIDYNTAVVYPFGYGLSYTTFTQEFVGDFSIPENAGLNDYVDVQVKVTNVGDVVGKEVVQIYNHAPYIDGQIEKAEVVLVGFAKTGLLQPADSETVTVSVRVGDLASFDWNDANGDGFYGYEIEAFADSGADGYELRLQSNSHEMIDSLGYEVDSTLSFNNDGSRTALPVGNEKNVDNLAFSNGDDWDSVYLVSKENGGDFVIFSRADFEGTFPTSPTGQNTYKEGVPEKYNNVYTPDMDEVSDPWYVKAEDLPESWTQGSGTNFTIGDMVGIDYTSAVPLTADDTSVESFIGKTGAEVWDLFMNQLTWEELVGIISTGHHQTAAVDSILKPTEYIADGPEQLGSGTFWAGANIIAGTFNTELAELRGVAVANEALYNGIHGWYGPAANLNRTPFGGRNTIYASEDGLLAGKITASTIVGAQSRGLVCYVKHFALNEQETNRMGLATFLTEQALRETYLKSFEYAVKEGGTLGIMQAFNRVGGVNCFGNYALDVTVLREEWGFKGVVVTDSYSTGLVRENIAQRVGGDLPLGSWGAAIAGEWDAARNAVVYNGEVSSTQWSVVRRSALHVLYMASNSCQLRNGYNTVAVTGKTISDVSLKVNEPMATVDGSIDTQAFGTDKISYSATNLPAGVSIDAATGAISGTPTKSGNYTATVTVSVTEEGEGWITSSYTLKFVVAAEEEPDDSRDEPPAVQPPETAEQTSGCGSGCNSAADAGLCGGAFALVLAVLGFRAAKMKKDN